MGVKPKIVIVGGGFGGLEAAFLARMKLRDEVDITLISDRQEFLFKPNTIYIPFGAEVDQLLVSLPQPLRKRDIRFIQQRVHDVDPDHQRIYLDSGERVSYDYLILATGATMRPNEVPGLDDHASTIWTPNEMYELRGRLDDLKELSRQRHQEVLFVVPPNNKCSGPLYEMVFMLETWLRRNKIRDRVGVTYSTYENTFIQAFGPRLHDVVTREFAARGIVGYTGEQVEKVIEGEVTFGSGQAREFDLLISFPPYAAAMSYPMLSHDDRGFLATELATRQVVGYPNIYAPGDGGDFPIKQAFLAFLQADAVASHISHRVTGAAFDSPFDSVSMCVMEMLDTATFAQVPVRTTGDPIRPVEVRPDQLSDYRVGTHKIWRLGKKLLGVYLPWRFKAGKPFHAGPPWKAMEIGLRAMSSVFATGSKPVNESIGAHAKGGDK